MQVPSIQYMFIAHKEPVIQCTLPAHTTYEELREIIASVFPSHGKDFMIDYQDPEDFGDQVGISNQQDVQRNISLMSKYGGNIMILNIWSDELYDEWTTTH